jgi:hypothetical protein
MRLFLVLFVLTLFFCGCEKAEIKADLTRVIFDPQPENNGVSKGGTYYLDVNTGDDANSGTEDSPWQTFNKAANTLNPGDTVLVKNGNYYKRSVEWYNINIGRSGAPGAYITYRAYPGHRPRISVDTYNGLQIWDANYIVVDGFEIVGLTDPPDIVGAPENAPVRNKYKNDPRYFGNGISIFGKNGWNNVIVKNCVVNNVGGNGIAAANGTLLKIENNLVYNCAHRSEAGNSGISTYHMNDLSITTKNYGIVIIGNTIHNCINYINCTCSGKWKMITDGNGVILDHHDATDYKHRTLLVNNLAFNNGGRGFHVFKSSFVDIIHNTSYMNLRTKVLHRQEGEIGVVESAKGDCRFFNNIAVARSGCKAYNIPEGTVFKNNLVFSDRLDQPVIDATNIINQAPSFINPDLSNFRLNSNSPAVDKGSTLFTTARDKDNRARPYGKSVDIGAYEFMP